MAKTLFIHDEEIGFNTLTFRPIGNEQTFTGEVVARLTTHLSRDTDPNIQIARCALTDR
ncbi:Uncharacterised protein [Vibrio cholerae]|uniref:Uncharacterized protein n=1 Tax=Vibrio cholerae TaxID=666 RepID=A0A655ZZZ4_VIBCL|nr:Uncharacterised protein [Vibrio cholerae]CSB22193.1 Uncharacterised protein [Vibrio cholerae]CSC47223.1 Uncharacterised protein [Vibrio cholerae]CSC53109.1 Uncharacterised protein [Vibrio cholerae]CSC76463.1 Uncharacterised protein [Vibrio cholerae]